MEARSEPYGAAAATIVPGEALEVLGGLPGGCAGLVYADPPFNTGQRRRGVRTRATADPAARRAGFAGRLYRVDQRTGDSFDDVFLAADHVPSRRLDLNGRIVEGDFRRLGIFACVDRGERQDVIVVHCYCQGWTPESR